MMSENHIENNENIVITIGISGVTCGGKTTTAIKLQNILPNTRIISQDDYYILDEQDPRHVWIPELNHVNYDILSSLDMNKMYEDVLKAIGKRKRRKKNDSGIIHVPEDEVQIKIIQEISKKSQESNVSFLIVEGFSIFNYEPLAQVLDMKYYFILDYAECMKRRITRVYDPPDCPGYFEKCVWPEHIKQLSEIQSCIKDITFFNGNGGENFIEKILGDIVNNL
ncbi:unnamed protein product [Phaedon cochleariae]|uniref:Nicotinamide riboside kinase 1 n=1 Tax=Phaedon cochleariae TaxID=80249 RepID=A0A9P0DJ52_PHACE|nr:unnamed protein product [Phaedon cochleariae]